MNKALFLIVASIVSATAMATPFDDKARAADALEQQAYFDKAYRKAHAEITENNVYMTRRIPRGATNVQCFDRQASIWRKENGCWMANTEWNGYPVQVCSNSDRSNNRRLPVQIRECQFHLPNGRDCQIFPNASSGRCL